jgi:hypothetical protein
MSRPDLQTGFNGWQAIDPTPPPQFWQKNGGGKYSVYYLYCICALFSIQIYSFPRQKEPWPMGC